MEEQDNQSQTPEPTPTTKPHVDIKDRVKQLLAESGPRVREAVVAALTDEQIDRRQRAVIAALQKIDAKEKEIRKAEGQGDIKFDLAGAKVGNPSYSKQQLDEIKKLREECNKLVNALTVALDQNNWDKLFGLTGGN